MDPEKVTIALAALKLGSMSAAAARLGYTPSGVARVVDSIETELGVRLARRTSHGIVPTPEARQITPALRDLVRADARARQAAEEARGALTGEILVGTYSSIAAGWLPQILQAFERECPRVRVRTRESGSDQLVRWVEDGSIDLALLARRSFTGDWVPLRDDRLMAWLPPGHPRSGDAAFPINELEGAPFIETSPRQDTDNSRLLAAEHVTPDVRYTTTSSYTSYRMVEAGLGMTVNNELMSAGWHGRVAIIPLDPPRSVSLGIAVRSLAAATPAARRFVDCAQRVVCEL